MGEILDVARISEDVKGEKRMERITFGRWLREKLAEQDLSLQALTKLTGVDVGTVSRIANEHTQATLSTAIRLCEGLRVSPEALFQALQGRQDALDNREAEGSTQGKSALTLDDVEGFLLFFMKKPKPGRELVASLLTSIADELTLREQTSIPGVLPEEVEKLWNDDYYYSYELLYPPEMTAKTIWEVYRLGGVLISSDIGAYTADLPVERRVQAKKLDRHLINLLSRPEMGSAGRIKLVDVLSLDERLGQRGDIFCMYWSVSKFDDEIVSFMSAEELTEGGLVPSGPNRSIWRRQMSRLVYILVTISRWLQCLSWEDVSWLDALRREITTSRKPTDTALMASALLTPLRRAGTQEAISEMETQDIRIEGSKIQTQYINIEGSEIQTQFINIGGSRVGALYINIGDSRVATLYPSIETPEIKSPEPAEDRNVRGISKEELIASDPNRYAGVLAAFEQILRLDPDDIDANFGKAATLKLLGRAEEAQRIYEKALQLTGKSQEATHDKTNDGGE